MNVEGIKTNVRSNYEIADSKKREVAKEPAKVETEKKVNTEDKNETRNIEVAVEKINKHLEISNTRIKFKIHESETSLNNKVSIKVIDEDSDKVIAEIPSEEAIELSERMEQIIGFLFDECK